MMESIKSFGSRALEFCSKWYMLTSALLLAILVYFLDSKNKTITDLNDQILRLKIADKLKDLKAKAEIDDKSCQEASQSYTDFKRTHSALLARLGVRSPNPTRPDPSRD